jgi:hypothetical protein
LVDGRYCRKESSPTVVLCVVLRRAAWPRSADERVVAQLPDGFDPRRTLGWLAWLGLHLAYLIGFRSRVTVFVNWTWCCLSWTSGPRVIIGARSGRTIGPDDPVTT